MTAEEIAQAMAEARPAAVQEPKKAMPSLQDALQRALPSASDVERWRDNEARRAAREAQDEAERRKQAEARAVERKAERKAAIEELSGRLDPKLLRAVRGNPTRCAVLLGPTGCGKTTAARLLDLLAPRFAGFNGTYWIRAADLATAERRHGLGMGWPPELERAREAQALVIDDVGNERETSSLMDVLDHRYANGLPTIVTSGFTKKELSAHIGAAAVRRIVEQHVEGMSVLMVDCYES